jgi:hypothetical protein
MQQFKLPASRALQLSAAGCPGDGVIACYLVGVEQK